jgi:hypothetical protein
LSNSVKNERIFAFAKPYTWNEILSIMRKAYPSRSFPEDLVGVQKSTIQVPTIRGEQLLRDVFGRSGWTPLEETIQNNLKGLE